MEWSEGGKCDNCNSIINKIYVFFKRNLKKTEFKNPDSSIVLVASLG